MAIITHVTKDDNEEWQAVKHEFDGLAWEWIVANIPAGENFAVYNGDVCESNEVSRDDSQMEFIESVTIVMLPSAVAIPFIVQALIAVVVAVAVTLLIPDPDIDASSLQNQQAGSGNNDLSDRKNKVRINQRIVDFSGENLSVPDVIQPEYSYFDASGIDNRIGAYAFCRNQCDVAQLSDGENLFQDISGASAQVYYPFKSPNNSAPDIQIGEPINEDIVGVYRSINAVGQTLEAPEVRVVPLTSGATLFVNKGALFAVITDPSIDPSDYTTGDTIILKNVYVDTTSDGEVQMGSGTALTVIASTTNDVTFDISSSPEFLLVDASSTFYPIISSYNPAIQSPDVLTGDSYKIKRVKVNRLLFNVYCPQGIYKRAAGDKQSVSVSFRVAYYLLDDNFNRVGSRQFVSGSITGATDNNIGSTIDISLGSASHVEWTIFRTSFEDLEFDGTVVDVLKLKSVFGLFDINMPHFGNITMVQTKRKALEQVTAIANPEVNAICTEMTYKYLGGGSFDGALSKNTQAFQSLISHALDPKIGRLTVNELDLDLLLSVQNEIDSYYSNDRGGRCSYSFDDLNMSAQDVFMLISNCASSIIWREGRVLKAWFERAQSIPQMVFTHRSKLPDSETWSRSFKSKYDGVSFKYIDDTNNQETIIFPENSVNTKPYDIKGIKGLDQATWRMMREYNKLQHQKITVDFTATAEGRFVRPSRMIGVVKGSRVGQTGGEVLNVNLLTVELSQEVNFTPGDDHFIMFKKRDGSVDIITCSETSNKRIVELQFAPTEPLYFGNSARKTEFSFGNEARLDAQKMLPQTINASENTKTEITAINYSDEFYKDDGFIPPGAYSNGYNSGYN